MKQWDSVFNNNHLRLMRVHIGFIVFYIMSTALILIYSANNSGNQRTSVLANIIVAVVFNVPLISLHGLLAFGAKKKFEMSRKASEIVFAIMLLGFPIGTLLSLFYFLPKTTWKQPSH